MLKNKQMWVFLTLCGIAFTTGCATSYQKEIKNKITKELGVDYKDYVFRAQPVGTFGVGTMYLSHVSDKETIKEGVTERFLVGRPSTWFADTVSEEEKKEIMEKMIAKGDTGKFNLSDTISTKLGLDATVPIKEIVTAGVEVNYKKGISIMLKAESATDRQLDLTVFKKAANEKFSPEMQEVIKHGEFIIGAKDVVLNGYSVEVKIDKTINPKLDLALNQAIGMIIGKDTRMNVSRPYNQSGTYVITASEPVIAAVLWKMPPPVRSGEVTISNILKGNIESWETRYIPEDVLQPLEKLLTE